MDKRERIKQYFEPLPKNNTKLPLLVISIGVLFLFAGIVPPYELSRNAVMLLFGIPLFWMGRRMKRRQKEGISERMKTLPTDDQMDTWLEEDLRTFHGKAMVKTGTDESELVAETVMVTGPRFWNTGGAPAKFKKGNDNVLRFTPVGVTVINFTASQLLCYSAVLDLTTGDGKNESTDEYFYRDVVSVSTKTKNITVKFSAAEAMGAGVAGGQFGADKSGLQLTAAETFELTTSGGTSIEVILRDPGLVSRMGGGEMPTTRAEKAIQAVRKMVRESKSATA